MRREGEAAQAEDHPLPGHPPLHMTHRAVTLRPALTPDL